MSFFDLDSPAYDASLDLVSCHLARTSSELEPIGSIARHHWARPGRRLQARIALTAADAYGVESDVAVGIATACELLGEAVLIHEDVRSEAPLRRGQPSIGALFGSTSASHFADYLLMLAIDEVGRIEGVDPAFIRLFTTTSLQVLRGIEIEASGSIAIARCADAWIANARRKDGALLALPLEAVMRRGGASDADQVRARAAMEWVGVASCKTTLSAASLHDFSAFDDASARARRVASKLPAAIRELIEAALEDVAAGFEHRFGDSAASLHAFAHDRESSTRWLEVG